ncbi:MAG TPA: hypothetical protein VE987_15820 [Polyangiaceae bacterium]|nr:hypothetical protein [Polyangiaceae bacterium]
MRDNLVQRVCSLVALGGVAIVPFAMACGGGSNNPPPNTAGTATANVGMAPPPPGYPGAQPPPGYPATPPPGYPAQPPGYPAQTAYPPPAQTAAPYPTAPQSQPTYPPPPGGAPAPAPTASTPPPLAPTDPNSLQGILAGIQGALQGTVVPGGAMSGDVTDAGLKLSAVRVAPGMQAEGDELKQTLSEGQHAVMMVTMQAGKCYTIVGFSPPGGVKDLDLNLLAPPFYMTLAGQDLTHNNAPAIGASPSPMCPVTPFPLQYKLDVFAKSGSGQVAVQLYSKAKS